MLLYLYLIDGKPQARTDLELAQAALEDKLRERRDVSDIWWGDENPYIPRVYLYGGLHSDYLAAEAADEDAEISWEEEDQLIFPVEIPEPQVPTEPVTGLKALDSLGPVTVQLVMTVASKDGTRTIMRGFSDQNWPRDAKGKANCLKSFTSDVEWALINEWRNEEGS